MVVRLILFSLVFVLSNYTYVAADGTAVFGVPVSRLPSCSIANPDSGLIIANTYTAFASTIASSAAYVSSISIRTSTAGCTVTPYIMDATSHVLLTQGLARTFPASGTQTFSLTFSELPIYAGSSLAFQLSPGCNSCNPSVPAYYGAITAPSTSATIGSALTTIISTALVNYQYTVSIASNMPTTPATITGNMYTMSQPQLTYLANSQIQSLNGVDASVNTLNVLFSTIFPVASLVSGFHVYNGAASISSDVGVLRVNDDGSFLVVGKYTYVPSVTGSMYLQLPTGTEILTRPGDVLFCASLTGSGGVIAIDSSGGGPYLRQSSGFTGSSFSVGASISLTSVTDLLRAYALSASAETVYQYATTSQLNVYQLTPQVRSVVNVTTTQPPTVPTAVGLIITNGGGADGSNNFVNFYISYIFPSGGVVTSFRFVIASIQPFSVGVGRVNTDGASYLLVGAVTVNPTTLGPMTRTLLASEQFSVQAGDFLLSYSAPGITGAISQVSTSNQLLYQMNVPTSFSVGSTLSFSGSSILLSRSYSVQATYLPQYATNLYAVPPATSAWTETVSQVNVTSVGVLYEQVNVTTAQATITMACGATPLTSSNTDTTNSNGVFNSLSGFPFQSAGVVTGFRIFLTSITNSFTVGATRVSADGTALIVIGSVTLSPPASTGMYSYTFSAAQRFSVMPGDVPFVQGRASALAAYLSGGSLMRQYLAPAAALGTVQSGTATEYSRTYSFQMYYTTTPIVYTQTIEHTLTTVSNCQLTVPPSYLGGALGSCPSSLQLTPGTSCSFQCNGGTTLNMAATTCDNMGNLITQTCVPHTYVCLPSVAASSPSFLSPLSSCAQACRSALASSSSPSSSSSSCAGFVVSLYSNSTTTCTLTSVMQNAWMQAGVGGIATAGGNATTVACAYGVDVVSTSSGVESLDGGFSLTNF